MVLLILEDDRILWCNFESSYRPHCFRLRKQQSARIYVGGIPKFSTERDIEDAFRRFGSIKDVWVARNPPGFAFVDFAKFRDAEDAVRNSDLV